MKISAFSLNFFFTALNEIDGIFLKKSKPGRVAQSVTCLATDGSLTADPGVASSIPAGPIVSWRLIMK